MKATELLATLAELGVLVSLSGDNIKVQAPPGIVDDRLRQVLRAWKPDILDLLSSPIFIDLETRSACNLKKCGGRRYAQHATTEIMTAVAKLGNTIYVWAPLLSQPLPTNELRPTGFERTANVLSFAGPELPAPLAAAISAGHPLCAHNCDDFDALVWLASGLPEPTRWIDTLHDARAGGLPGKLDEIGQRLLGHGKDEEGANLLKRLSRPNRRGEMSPLSPEHAKIIARYNVADVLLLEAVYDQVDGLAENGVLAVHRAINERGICFDKELAVQLVKLLKAEVREAAERVQSLTGGNIKTTNMRCRQKFLDWLRQQGIQTPNMTKGTVEALLKQPTLDAAAAGVLRGWQVANRQAAAKLETAIAKVDADGRLRHMLNYHTAITGRFSGRDVQPHNLPRPHEKLKNLDPLIAVVNDIDMFTLALPAGVTLTDAVSSLVRPCFRAAPYNFLCIGDWASVEARGLAWIAGEQRQLQLFAEGADNYLDFAAIIFGRPVTKSDSRERALGKVTVLGGGYQLGPSSFAAKCEADGVDLAAANVTAGQVIETYRDTYPAICGDKVTENGITWRVGGLWNDLNTAAIDAVLYRSQQYAGHCVFELAGGSLQVLLPSGRSIFYRNARVENRVPPYCERLGLPARTKPTVVYDSPKARGVLMFGGKFAENVTQAICRDLLAGSLIACEQAGLPVVMHVHDEIVIEASADQADESLRRLLVIMSTPPAWAAGFPVEVEGFCTQRYLKKPPEGTLTYSARNGQIVGG